MARLREPEEPVARLMERAAGLGDKLGPILLQLPPTLRADADLLDRCLRCFAPDVRLADRLGRPMTPLWRTADWGYLRLHEGRAKQWPCYGRQALRTWAERLAETWSADDDVFVYFNNDQGGAAIDNAVTFAAEVTRSGREVTRASGA